MPRGNGTTPESLFRNLPKLLRDARFLRVAGQVLLQFGVCARHLTSPTTYNRQLGIRLGFDFLKSQTSLDIGETLISYNRSNSFARAIIVGCSTPCE